jgi:hypothetical protein
MAIVVRGAKILRADEQHRKPRRLVGKFRLDWIFVKAYLKDDPKSAESYRFAPRFARTMNEANQAFADPLSDHAAISVDLPIIQSTAPSSKNSK